MPAWASIGLALLVLGFNLWVQSRIIFTPINRQPLLGRRVQSLTNWVLLPTAAVLLVFGVVVRALLGSWVLIGIGITLVILAISLRYQSRILIGTKTKDEFLSLGREFTRVAIIYAALGSIVVMTAIVVTAVTIFCK